MTLSELKFALGILKIRHRGWFPFNNILPNRCLVRGISSKGLGHMVLFINGLFYCPNEGITEKPSDFKITHIMELVDGYSSFRAQEPSGQGHCQPAAYGPFSALQAAAKSR